MARARLLHPASKLGTVRLWQSSTLASELGIEDADADELYEALDWLFERQAKVEEKLAGRHLTEGGSTVRREQQHVRGPDLRAGAVGA